MSLSNHGLNSYFACSFNGENPTRNQEREREIERERERERVIMCANSKLKGGNLIRQQGNKHPDITPTNIIKIS